MKKQQAMLTKKQFTLDNFKEGFFSVLQIEGRKQQTQRNH